MFSNLNQTVDTENIIRIFIGIIIVLAKTAFPIMLFIMAIGLAINFFQVGLNFSAESIEFKLDKLNPINGFGRIFSKRALVELAKSFFKIIVIGFFLYRFIHEQILAMPQFMFFDLTTSLALVAEIIYQRWQTTQDLKMTKQEVKDEMKQTEGDPQIKGKIRQKQRQMAMARMMKEVPKADVIITNPTHYAVALSYEQGMVAPTVVAKGQDLVAQRIKEIGRDARVPIIENKPLARTLYAAVQVGDAVPHELYQAVAEVLAYVYRLKHARRGA